MKCPVCKVPLNLRQINLDSAVYLCEQSTCTYPLGFEWKIVPRKIDDIFKPEPEEQELKNTENTNTASALDDLDKLISQELSHDQVARNSDLFDFDFLEKALFDSTSGVCENKESVNENCAESQQEENKDGFI